MRVRVLLTVAVSACLGLAGCGGEGGSGEGVTASTAETADPREGFFAATESEALNPPLARFSAAWNAYLEDGEACNEEAQRLFDDGASPRKAVQCHLRENEPLADATREIREAVDDLDGDFRPECDAGVERFSDALEELETARRRVLDGYERYARSGQVAPRLQERSTEADELSQALIGEELVALTEACYTEEDREQVEQR